MRVPDQWELPDQIVARLGIHTAGRQRAICEDGHLVLVLHQPPGPDRSQRRAAYFWRNAEGQWKCSERGKGIQVLRDHLLKYRQVEERLEEKYESAQRAQDYFRLLEDLVPLHRSARNQAAALQAARDGVSGDRELIEIRDESGEVERALEILYIDTKNALEFDTAKAAEEQNRIGEQTARAGHRLNVMAALFFPLTAVASVFGMNMPLGVEEASLRTAWMVVGAAVGVGGMMLYWITGSGDRNGRS